MKSTIRAQKNNKFIPIILMILLAVSILSLLTLKLLNISTPFSVVNTITNVKKAQNTTDQQITKDKTKASQTNVNVDVTKKTSEIPISTETTIAIENHVQTSDAIDFSIKITNPGATGTCVVTFTKSISKPVVAEISTVNNVCGPISVPLNGFDTFGEWVLNVRYYTNNSQATSTQNINIL